MQEYCRLHKENGTLVFAIMRLWETQENGENLEVRIEKEDDMDTYAEFTLPAYYCHHAYGFKETELMEKKISSKTTLSYCGEWLGGEFVPKALLDF